MLGLKPLLDQLGEILILSSSGQKGEGAKAWKQHQIKAFFEGGSDQHLPRLSQDQAHGFVLKKIDVIEGCFFKVRFLYLSTIQLLIFLSVLLIAELSTLPFLSGKMKFYQEVQSQCRNISSDP